MTSMALLDLLTRSAAKVPSGRHVHCFPVTVTPRPWCWPGRSPPPPSLSRQHQKTLTTSLVPLVCPLVVGALGSVLFLVLLVCAKRSRLSLLRYASNPFDSFRPVAHRRFPSGTSAAIQDFAASPCVRGLCRSAARYDICRLASETRDAWNRADAIFDA